jgi:hypothetical protein
MTTRLPGVSNLGCHAQRKTISEKKSGILKAGLKLGVLERDAPLKECAPHYVPVHFEREPASAALRTVVVVIAWRNRNPGFQEGEQ